MANFQLIETAEMANYQLTKDCLKLLKWLIIG